MTSLPVPLSPVISTAESVAATLLASSASARMLCDANTGTLSARAARRTRRKRAALATVIASRSAASGFSR